MARGTTPRVLVRLPVRVALLVLLTCVSGVDDDGYGDFSDGYGDSGSDFDLESQFAGANAEAASDATEFCSDDDGQAPAPAPARSGRKATRRRPSFCTQQREYVDSCRRSFDANPRGFCSRGWVVPPPAPSFTTGRGHRPDPAGWWLKPWGGWVPERLFPEAVQAPPCPHCPAGSVNAATAKWQKRLPRFALTLRPDAGGFFFLDSKTYRCNGCGKPFLEMHWVKGSAHGPAA